MKIIWEKIESEQLNENILVLIGAKEEEHNVCCIKIIIDFLSNQCLFYVFACGGGILIDGTAVWIKIPLHQYMCMMNMMMLIVVGITVAVVVGAK